MKMTQMKDVDLSGQRVLIREDLNVPIKDGKVGSDARIRASLPTIQHAHEAGAMVMLMSHIGRPIEGQYDEAFSLQPVAEHLSALLDHPVRLEKDWIDGVNGEAGDIILCENVRFNVGEKADDASLAKKWQPCAMFLSWMPLGQLIVRKHPHTAWQNMPRLPVRVRCLPQS